ncbi:ATP-dependent dethiobiotin synthetase BioD [Pleurocapsales cyanobacterium LEGE 06147]|nr:ATP-dependent dethiobiotin synthetase BioD [Pleurocapsales cyanobacterium LEGE 06147]
MQTLLIVGTDTGVGKTVLTISLTAYWQTYRFCNRLGLMKLMQTGEGDRELYSRLFGHEDSLTISNPLCYSTPIAPPLAAAKEGQAVDLKIVWEALCNLQQQQDFVLVEGLGGLGSPVTEELTVAHLAADWHLPTVLVVPVRLGAIAQAVANVAFARSLGINLRGIILSCSNAESEGQLADLAPVSLIQSLTQIPVLGILPYISELTDTRKLTRVASNLDLELFLPV